MLFLETLGKLFFSKMRPLLFFSLLALPLLFALFSLYSQFSYFQQLEETFQSTQEKAKRVYEKKRRKERFLARYSQADPFYLDRKIESFSFLANEREYLKTLLKHPAISNKTPFAERMHFFSENRIAFTEEAIRSSPSIKETEEKQRFPVQMDEADLKKLLCLIEDLPIDSFEPEENRPQFLIHNFRLQKKQTSLQTEVLEVEMELLKREFL